MINKLSQAKLHDSNKTASDNPGAIQSLPLKRLQVQGATCGGWVKSIEQTLKSVAGVSEVSMDLATGIASVIGVVEPNNLTEALNRAGFPATVIG